MTCYSGFGNLADGTRPIWIGDFNGTGRADVLFFYYGDKNWWLGSHQGPGGQITWPFAGNTAGFGNSPEGCPVWIGNFSRRDRSEVLFYYPGDGNWWLGSHDGNQLSWSFAGNTSGYQPPANPLHPQCQAIQNDIGDLKAERASLQEELRHAAPGEKAAIVGQIRAINRQIVQRNHDFQVCLAAHPQQQPPAYPNFGNLADGRPFWIGNFSQADRAEILFYYPGDDNWWLGTHDGNQLNWTFAGNTTGFGRGHLRGQLVYVGNFSRADRAEILFYYPGDDNWWLGTHDGNQLSWTFAGNTTGFGRGHLRGQLVYVGNFSRADRAEILFYYPGDGNWWLGSHDGNQLSWSFAGNTGRPCRESVVVHFKSLRAITQAINTFFDDQLAAMEQLFSEGGIAVYRGTTEDLSGNAALVNGQLDLDVGNCLLGVPTADHVALFANRNNVGRDDLVVYLVRSMLNGAAATNLLGCATHPNGQPGAAVIQAAARWLVAHEVGHVLGLLHVDNTVATNSDFLMWPNVGWTNVPPDISTNEYTTMFNSALTRQC